jgi:methylenetetrahydrofolate--tRNA-(uracil-5-)-methyltransferase
MTRPVVIVGGGLAGVEAAWQCARRGVDAVLYEMRPAVMTPAHRTGLLAELVCSNSLKSQQEGTAAALLKEDMRALGSLVMRAAAETSVPAGGALAVDRERFAERITAILEAEPRVTVVREEVTAIPEAPAVVAAGPLASAALAAVLSREIGRGNLYFFDALAPVVAAASIDRDRAFEASRYGKGAGGYLNCPLERDEYYAFVDALLAARTAPLRDYETGLFFEACLPLEEHVRRGRDTLRFGPFKPIGLGNPAEGESYFAAVQLRREDAAGSMWGLVGCQTRLLPEEQRRVFRMIPALANADFLRYGAAHRNTYISGPAALRPTLELRTRDGVFIAGQLTGVEGYVESAATGIVAGINAARNVAGAAPVYPPRETMLGALLRYVSSAPLTTFAPMNANFGLLPRPDGIDREQMPGELGARARAARKQWLRETGVGHGPD